MAVVNRGAACCAVAALMSATAGLAIAQSEAPAGEDPKLVPPEVEVPDLTFNLNNFSNRFVDVIKDGHITVNNRVRFEFADQETDPDDPGGIGDSSFAVTNRLRLGYQTGEFKGFSGFFEIENVVTPDTDTYFVPFTGDGDPTRTEILDPPGTEVNQAFIRYKTDNFLNTGAALDVKAGRQRIIYDDARFIGNVGWRQFELTYDAVRIDTDFGIPNLNVSYAFVFKAEGVGGPDAAEFDSDSHFININYKVADELTIIPFAYFIDIEQLPAASNNTTGIRATGTLFADNPSPFAGLAYEATFAAQTSGKGNSTIEGFNANFFQIKGTFQTDSGHGAGAEIQFLGSDDTDGISEQAFLTPFGTNHAFQGFADVFLVTPDSGIQDVNFFVQGPLFFGISGFARYHLFFSADDGDQIGEEFDFILRRRLTDNSQILAKFAAYRADVTEGVTGQPFFLDPKFDIVRAWLQYVITF